MKVPSSAIEDVFTTSRRYLHCPTKVSSFFPLVKCGHSCYGIDDFCEYILPYRVGDEPLEKWREAVYQKYNPMLDSLRATANADDLMAAVTFLIPGCMNDVTGRKINGI